MRLRWQQWLQRIPYNDPVEYHLMLLLQLLLFVLIATLLCALGLNVLIFRAAALTWSGVAPNLIVLVGLLAALGMLRYGALRWSVWTVIVLLLGGLAQALLTNGLQRSQGLLIEFTLPIILAGMLLERWALIVVCAVSIATAIAAALLFATPLRPVGAVVTPLPVFILVTVLLGVLIDRFAATLRLAFQTAVLRKLALEAERERFAVTLASIGDAVIATDPQGNITFMNQIAATLTGWDAAAAYGQPLDSVFTIINETTRQPVASPAARVLREGAIVGLANHTLLIARDGREIPIDDSCAPIREASGKLYGVVLIFRDVTERKQAEHALRASETRFRVMANAAPMLIWMADPSGTCTFVNQRWLAFTGRTLEQELGNGWTAAVHPGDLERCLSMFEQALAARIPFEMVYRLRRADGVYRWMLDQGTPLLGEDSQLAGFIGSCVDITERQLLEDRLSTLIAASGSLLQSLQMRDVLPTLLDLAQEIVEADAYAVWRHDHERSQWQVLASVGLSEEFKAAKIESLGSTPTVATQLYRISNVAVDLSQELAARAALYRQEGIQALLVVPLHLHNNYSGTLVFYYHAPHDFSDLEVRVATALANLAAAAINTADLYEAQQQLRLRAEAEQREQAFLADASAVLSTSLDYSVTLRQISDWLVPTLADWVALYMLDAAGHMQQLFMRHRSPEREMLALEWQEQHPLSPERSAALRQVLSSGQPLLMPQLTKTYLDATVYSADQRSRIHELGLSSFLLVPLLARGRTLGVLALGTVDDHTPYSEQQVPFFLELGHRIAIAVDNTRLYTEAEQARLQAESSRERLARLQTTTAALSQALTPDQVIAVIVGEGRAGLGAQVGLVALRRPGEPWLDISGSEGIPPEILAEFRTLPLAATMPIAQAARSGDSVYIASSAEFEQRADALALPLQRRLGLEGLIALPLVVEQQIIGALQFSFKQPLLLQDADRAFVQALARQCAQALDRARLYDESQRALDARDQFLAVASHELKTPTTSILGYAQLLQRRISHNGEVGERIAKPVHSIIHQATRLNRLTLSLLDLSRLQTGQLTISRSDVNLLALVERVAQEAQLSTDRHQIHVAVPEQELRLVGDELRLEQVIYNLLQNAIKYSPDGGAINITVRPSATSVQIAIADHGVGIAAADLPQLFQRFYRAPTATTLSVSGMGLGLYIVQEIIALHHGSIDVQSELGAGSTFTITLPLAD